MVFCRLMDFNPNDYVQRGSPQDNFPDGVAEIINCRYCSVPMLITAGLPNPTAGGTATKSSV